MASPVNVVIVSMHGPPTPDPTLSTDVTGGTIPFKRADNDALDATNTVPVPDSGENLSWVKWITLVATNLPDNAVSDIRFYSNGVALGIGRTVWVAQEPSTGYTQPSAADEATAISAVDVAGFTVGSPLTLQPGNWVVDTDTAPTANNALLDWIRLQMSVDSTAVAGDPSSPMLLSYRYNER